MNCSRSSRSSDVPEDSTVPELGPDPDKADVQSAIDVALGDEVISIDPLRDAQGRLRLSFTRVDTFENCPRRFRYQYVDGLPQAPAPQLSFGSSLHAALEWLYDRKHPVLPTLEETLQALFDRWESEGYAEVDRTEQLSAYEHARRIITDLHARIEKEGFRLPAAVEAWFELPFADDVVVVGAIDRIDAHEDGSLHVVDYKTNRRARTRSQVRGSLQLAIYALATRELYGRLPDTVALDFIVPGVTVAVPVHELDLDAVPDRLAAVAARVRAGEDTPTPNRLCDWCDFRAICPAWSGDVDPVASADGRPESEEPTTLGRAVQERDRLARSLVRDARRLRQLEAAIERLGTEAPDA
jgi:putative RecB family exonuclease